MRRFSDRYVINYRASYEEETAKTIRYLVENKHIAPWEIAIFAQEDGFAQAGFNGARRPCESMRSPKTAYFASATSGTPSTSNLRFSRLRTTPASSPRRSAPARRRSWAGGTGFGRW